MSPIPPSGDMDAESFRKHGYEVVDWIAKYLAGQIGSQTERPGFPEYPVLSQVQPGYILQQLPAQPPRQPEPMDEILADFQNILFPGITHWNDPRFFAYFAISASGPGILGEMLMSALNVNAMLWRTSPAATELEEVVMGWLRQMIGLPETFEGVIMDTASVSTLCAIAAAREAAGLDMRELGMAGRKDLPRLRMYCSEQAHSSVEKAGLVLGLGRQGVRKIPVDADFRMRPEALVEAIEADLAAGHRPIAAVATVGTTSTTSIDPVPAMADIAAKYGLWLHVDAAYGGSAALLPEMRSVLDGCNRADSLVFNPHKWLFTPIDCSAFFTRRVEILKRAFSLVPEYLRTAEGDREVVKNYMDYGIQLGRRFRALKLWMIVRAFGWEGLAERLRGHIRLAQQFAAWVDDSPDFERLAPTPFSTVCFRANPGKAQQASTPEREAQLNQLNEDLLSAVNVTGEAFLSHTKLNERYTLRLAIGNLRTTEVHVKRAWEILQRELQKLEAFSER